MWIYPQHGRIDRVCVCLYGISKRKAKKLLPDDIDIESYRSKRKRITFGLYDRGRFRSGTITKEYICIGCTIGPTEKWKFDKVDKSLWFNDDDTLYSKYRELLLKLIELVED